MMLWGEMVLMATGARLLPFSLALLTACAPRGAGRTSANAGLVACDHGRCPDGYTCHHGRDRAGAPQPVCRPESGRCRFASDCAQPVQVCRRFGPELGVCWYRP